MALPNPLYVAQPPVQQYTVDKDTAQALAAGTISYFIDDDRTTPKSVYIQSQQPDLTYLFTDVGSVITLSAVGTPQYLGTDFIPYLWPYQGTPSDSDGTIELYYVEVADVDGVPQFTREAWPPDVQQGNNPTAGFTGSENIISNPQFSEVFFDTVNGYTFTVTGSDTVTSIAPDWNVVTTGSGTFTVNQIAVTNLLAPGLPAYALDIVSTGTITEIYLSQVITESPRLLENGYASGSLTVVSAIAGTPLITMTYAPSSPALSSLTLASGNAVFPGFTQISGTVATPTPATNSSPPTNGYMEIQISFPVSAHIQISCVQVVSVSSLSEIPDYIQESTPRQLDHMFHYYKEGLDFKPLKSFLVGWDFCLNPAQWGETQTCTTTPSYIWDQTIMASAVANVNVIRSASSSDPIACITTGANEGFYILQYISSREAADIALAETSANLYMYATVTGVVANVYLFAGGSLASIPTLPTTIGTIAANGVFTLTAANWEEVTLSNGQQTQFNINANTFVDYKVEAWDTTDFINDSNHFCMVVSFFVPTIATQVIIQSMSCVTGSVATRPSPQTATEVLNDCSYYYQKSFSTMTTPAQNVGTGTDESYGIQVSGAGAGGIGPIIRLPIEMRHIPTVTLYNPAAANAQIRNEAAASDWSASTATQIGTKGFITSGTTPGGSTAGQSSAVHWTADARLGIV